MAKKKPAKPAKHRARTTDMADKEKELTPLEREQYEAEQTAKRQAETAKQAAEAATGLEEGEEAETVMVVATKDGYDGATLQKAGSLFVWTIKPEPMVVLPGETVKEAKARYEKDHPKRKKDEPPPIPEWTRMATEEEIAEAYPKEDEG